MTCPHANAHTHNSTALSICGERTHMNAQDLVPQCEIHTRAIKAEMVEGKHWKSSPWEEYRRCVAWNWQSSCVLTATRLSASTDTPRLISFSVSAQGASSWWLECVSCARAAPPLDKKPLRCADLVVEAWVSIDIYRCLCGYPVISLLYCVCAQLVGYSQSWNSLYECAHCLPYYVSRLRLHSW